ncbi:MAG: NAD(P) transhydrogenase subunit alpha part 1 [Alphaproteobacteria bacterium MarineAlpha2_Bin1]|nr:MAG: NAD(P) transhydrogenase subunit alpha part 1 [Alphaproteobacteria bacterium MarineAlpha2_Bin1]
MKLAVLREKRDFEKRVSATPETVRKIISLGLEVIVEKGAGLGAQITDKLYHNAGATIFTNQDELKDVDIIIKVQRPINDSEKGEYECSNLKKDCILIGLLDPFSNFEQIKQYAEKNITAISLELVPRITRAQSMDVLSSQSNLAGYKSVLEAANEYGKAMPMMMTAAGTVAPAKVFVLGAGVAGLQAIATAKRLGAIVFATDVRPNVKEQVESLGAKFVMVETEEPIDSETSGGYAKEMSKNYKEKQENLVKETLSKCDIAICTALIPGKKAPILIRKETVQSMKLGSIIVDLAVEQGGNCECSEYGLVSTVNGVKVIGKVNFPSLIPLDSSNLYSKNILNFLDLLIKDKKDYSTIDWNDEIIKATTLTKDGKIVNNEFSYK